MGIHLMQPRFPLGRTYATPGALALDVDLSSYLRRHHCGDWGKLAVPAERDNGRPACWGIDIATAHSKQPGHDRRGRLSALTAETAVLRSFRMPTVNYLT